MRLIKNEKAEVIDESHEVLELVNSDVYLAKSKIHYVKLDRSCLTVEGCQARHIRMNNSTLFMRKSDTETINAGYSQVNLRDTQVLICNLSSSRLNVYSQCIGRLKEKAPSEIVCDYKSVPTAALPYDALPEGILTLYKFARVRDADSISLSHGVAIVTLQVPMEAQRVQPIGSTKVRVDKARVISHVPYLYQEDIGKPYLLQSNYDSFAIYRDGDLVSSRFDPNPALECSEGIHGFKSQRALARFLVENSWTTYKDRELRSPVGEFFGEWLDRHSGKGE